MAVAARATAVRIVHVYAIGTGGRYVQTRRDQLQAYRFQNRRALAALVSGDPNVVEPPMRRLTITTISGIMIAVLVTVGFTLFGLIRPKAGDSWKEAGSIIVEEDTGATFVLIDGTLHNVLNYASAVLAVGNNPHVVKVEQSDLGSTPRGSMIGISGLPSSLPSAQELVSYPASVCSRERVAGSRNDLVARVSVALGDDSDSRPLPPDTAVVVNTGPGTQDFLLLRGQRLAVEPGAVSTSLNVSGDALRVGGSFINAIPAGADLKAPTLAGAGDRSTVRVGSTTAVVGQLLHATGSEDYYVVMPDGVAPVNTVQRALLLTLPLSADAKPVAPIETTKSVALGAAPSKQWPEVVAKQLADLPSRIAAYDTTAADAGGVCAVFPGQDRQPVFAVPASTLPSFRTGGVTDTERSRGGKADDVEVPPGRAALIQSADGSATVFLVADSGVKFAAASRDVLAAFTYADATPTKLPAQLLALIPTGPALNPTEARRPVTR